MKSNMANTLKIFILLTGVTSEYTLIGMQQENSSYTRISQLTAGNSIISRATKIPIGTSIEVIYNSVDKSYFGTESGPEDDMGDRILFDNEAALIFKELEQIKHLTK
ncbi:hypothetical protein BH09DEP1_BH09DEP1_3220 [soil metagenome]